MRNLKKVLSLVLALAMVLSICMAGAGAVNYDDFTDEESITKKQAVETLVSLDVINGYNDGAEFRPAGNVTRAEMATMICRILAGGDNMIVDATKPVPTYADIDGHWAESYIEYCTSLGIVSGKSPTSFDPDADVTAAEAAKMVMTTLGYNADVEGFKGIGWDINTMAKANTLLLLNNLQGEISSSVPATREQVAQLLYNALSLPMVQNYSGTTANLWIGSGANAYQQTLLESKFNAEKLTGVIVANEYADLYGKTGIRKGTTRLALMDNGGDLTGETKVVEVSTELLDIGQSVIVYWNNATKRVLYGDTQDTGLNQVTEFKQGGRFIGGENGLDRSSITNKTEYFVNYDVGEAAVSDFRLSYFMTVPFATSDRVDLSDSTAKAAAEAIGDAFEREHGGTYTLLDNAVAGSPGTPATHYIGYTYERTFRPGDIIDSFHLGNMETIFSNADRVGDTAGNRDEAIIGEVYVATQSNKDISDELSWTQFEDRYLEYQLDFDKIDELENGNYIRAVDFNNDGDIDYVLKIEFDMHEIDAITRRNGNLTMANGAVVQAASMTASDELAEGDVVITTEIDGITYVDRAPSFEGKVDSYNMRNDILTVEGTEYGQSAIDNYTGYQEFIANAEKNVNYTYYQDHFGYIRVFAYPGGDANYLLMTDGWYRTRIDADEYAVKGYIDGKTGTYYTTERTGKLFVNHDGNSQNNQNNNWGQLVGFNDFDTNIPARGDTNEGIKYIYPDTTRKAVTNVAKYTMDDDEVLTLSDVKEYAYNKSHNVTNIKVDYVDLLETNGLSAGQSAFKGSYVMDTIDSTYSTSSAWYFEDDRTTEKDELVDQTTFTDGTHAEIAPNGEISVQATRDTVFYYVTLKNGSVDNVRMVTGYRNSLKVDKDDISAMYAVAKNTGPDAAGNNYWVADVIVIETNKDTVETRDVFFNIYSTQKNVKDTVDANVILKSSEVSNLVAELDNYNEYYHNGNVKVPMGFFTMSEPNADGVVKADEITTGYEKYGIYTVEVDRAIDLLTYLTTTNGKTLSYREDKVVVYRLDSKGTDRYGAIKYEAVSEDEDGRAIPVERRDKLIVYATGNNSVVYAINVTKSADRDGVIYRDVSDLYDWIAAHLTDNSDTTDWVEKAEEIFDNETTHDFVGTKNANNALDLLKDIAAKQNDDNTTKKELDALADAEEIMIAALKKGLADYGEALGLSETVDTGYDTALTALQGGFDSKPDNKTWDVFYKEATDKLDVRLENVKAAMVQTLQDNFDANDDAGLYGSYVSRYVAKLDAALEEIGASATYSEALAALQAGTKAIAPPITLDEDGVKSAISTATTADSNYKWTNDVLPALSFNVEVTMSNAKDVETEAGSQPGKSPTDVMVYLTGTPTVFEREDELNEDQKKALVNFWFGKTTSYDETTHANILDTILDYYGVEKFAIVWVQYDSVAPNTWIQPILPLPENATNTYNSRNFGADGKIYELDLSGLNIEGDWVAFNSAWNDRFPA